MAKFRFDAVLVVILLSLAFHRPASADILQTWVEARAGTGKPVHWVSQGGVYSYPSGELLFGMIGFDSSTVVPDDGDGEPVVHLTRKTYAYTDPATGEILTEYNGNPVAPIAYPYQLITYRLEDGLIHGDVEQGVEPNVRRIKSENGMRVTELGDDTLFINAHVFLDIPVGPERRLEAWENYDFFIHRDDAVDEPHQMSWQRYGDLPPWAGSGKAIYHLLSYRVESHDEFPTLLLEWAKQEKPMWLKPPADLEEIRALQRGEDGASWGRND
ncbi:MAG: DUF1838 family protein [Woeseiaceae bacterium]|nr:DUF1838 family protein [Woeseiaceae bacterium]